MLAVREHTEECQNPIMVAVVRRLYRMNVHLQGLLFVFQPLSQLGKHTVISSWAFALFKVSDHVYVLLMNIEGEKHVKS